MTSAIRAPRLVKSVVKACRTRGIDFKDYGCL